MRKITIPTSLIVFMIAASFSANTQDSSAIQKRLISQYALTQPTADNTDIVTAGAVLVFQKERLTMVAVSSQVPYVSTYKDGKIDLRGTNKLQEGFKRWPFGGGQKVPSSPTRVFVKNEKMWVTRINVRGNSVVFDLFTDAYGDNRFKASLIFPFNSGATPDDVAKFVGEVFTVQPGDDQSASATSGGGNRQPAAPPAAPPAAASAEPPAVIPPPPPPPPDAPQDPPKTITLGQTPDQVVAILGQPEKTAKIGNKQTYFYKDMKVIFVGGKVADVQ